MPKPKLKEPPRCRYEIVVGRTPRPCGELAVYRQNTENGTPLCKEHGEVAESYGIRIVAIEPNDGT